jgi:hypothetical protein
MTDREMLLWVAGFLRGPEAALYEAWVPDDLIGRLIEGRTLLDRHLFPEVSATPGDNPSGHVPKDGQLLV